MIGKKVKGHLYSRYVTKSQKEYADLRLREEGR